MKTEYAWYELWHEKEVFYSLSEPEQEHLLKCLCVAAGCHKKRVAIRMDSYSFTRWGKGVSGPYYYFFACVFGSQSVWHLNEILKAALGTEWEHYNLMWECGGICRSHLVLENLAKADEGDNKPFQLGSPWRLDYPMS